MGIVRRSESGLRALASHLDQRSFHRLSKVVILVLAAWFGGLTADHLRHDQSFTNIMALVILAALTIWYFIMVSAMVLSPLIAKIQRKNSSF